MLVLVFVAQKGFIFFHGDAYIFLCVWKASYYLIYNIRMYTLESCTTVNYCFAPCNINIKYTESGMLNGQ